jgi:phosphatidate cytidylyltransferase
MKERITTGILIALVGVPLLIFSEYIIYTVAFGILSAIAAWEMLRALDLNKNLLITAPTLVIAWALPLFTHTTFISSDMHNGYIMLVAAVLFAYLLYLAGLAVLTRGVIKYSDIAACYMGITYVVASFTALCLIRYRENGALLFGMAFIGSWISDIMAYFTGRFFGKHKLCPELSPKKTIEGAIGGIVFGVIAMILYGFIIDTLVPDVQASYLVLAVLGLLLSVVSQIGDLFASLIKRERGIKDYGTLLPGHGGIMDRFDSCLAVSTVLLTVCILFPPFV